MTIESLYHRDKLLSREEAAEYLGVKPETLAQWKADNRYRLPFIQVGRLIKYRVRDLDKWLDERTST